MRCAKAVKFALGTLGEAADTADLAQGGHALAPACEDFVGVGLVTHIPHHAVVWGIKDVMQSHSELYRA